MPDLRVLVVEDENLLDRVVADALRSIGLACETAPCAMIATEHLLAHRYNLMILDLRLQGGSGVSVLQQARMLYPEMPVILVTAYTMTDEMRHALALGVDALLYKPFDIDTLLATVRALLRRRVMPATTHAAVQMGASCAAPPVRQMGGLPLGAIATLKGATLALACRVRQMDEHALSVETECIELIPAARWQLEWTGDDALYQFTTRLLEYRP
ncbi:MAG: response regulator, partial [Fimbriimonadales bacterium]|nr:response regulator [Fimbriimonadales bacterium]